ncbi:alpha/beta fold hydrolase [Larkinella terrae]|uniref:Alpha/beta fold hydrolase n=1 Tax=Larkinella terrae TaxID=2025311 RepID=A0A7K0EUS6_9BACT|nr:alpha/beta hydrolase [Larkinella terrae]MRS65509.1 alpha/beta fold hydrolase [Larkinella terrae]
MSNKPAIVLIHGHGVDASIWDAVYEGLASDHSVVKPDLSAQTSHETMEAYAEDLYSLLQAAQIQSCVLIGHSMGGYIALALADQHPKLVSGLVLLNSTAFADDEAKKQSRQKAVESLQEQGSGPFIEQTVPKMFGEDFHQNHPAEVAQYVDRFSNLPANALSAGMKAMASRPDRVQVLKNASFPVLIIAGKQDQLVPYAKSQELIAAVPNAQTVVLEKSGHLGVIEQPDDVRKAVQNFISKL